MISAPLQGRPGLLPSASLQGWPYLRLSALLLGRLLLGPPPPRIHSLPRPVPPVRPALPLAALLHPVLPGFPQRLVALQSRIYRLRVRMQRADLWRHMKGIFRLSRAFRQNHKHPLLCLRTELCGSPLGFQTHKYLCMDITNRNRRCSRREILAVHRVASWVQITHTGYGLFSRLSAYLIPFHTLWYPKSGIVSPFMYPVHNPFPNILVIRRSPSHRLVPIVAAPDPRCVVGCKPYKPQILVIRSSPAFSRGRHSLKSRPPSRRTHRRIRKFTAPRHHIPHGVCQKKGCLRLQHLPALFLALQQHIAVVVQNFRKKHRPGVHTSCSYGPKRRRQLQAVHPVRNPPKSCGRVVILLRQGGYPHIPGIPHSKLRGHGLHHAPHRHNIHRIRDSLPDIAVPIITAVPVPKLLVPHLIRLIIIHRGQRGIYPVNSRGKGSEHLKNRPWLAQRICGPVKGAAGRFLPPPAVYGQHLPGKLVHQHKGGLGL